ncbi:unnamed protein product, partial [Mesorhabditis spiculigera]
MIRKKPKKEKPINPIILNTAEPPTTLKEPEPVLAESTPIRFARPQKVFPLTTEITSEPTSDDPMPSHHQPDGDHETLSEPHAWAQSTNDYRKMSELEKLEEENTDWAQEELMNAPGRMRASHRIPHPKPLTIDAVDMNMLGSAEYPTMVPTFTPAHPNGPEWRFTDSPYHLPARGRHLELEPQEDTGAVERFDAYSDDAEPEHETRNYGRKARKSEKPNGEISAPSPATGVDQSHMRVMDLITLLGCRDRDVTTCAHISEETCRTRPGYYLKLCPVKCKNCNGLLCYDSEKIDCASVKKKGGCKNSEPPSIALEQGLSRCKDELETCEQLATTGVCDHPYSQSAMRMYCAKSCGFCKDATYYMTEAPQKDEQKLPG